MASELTLSEVDYCPHTGDALKLGWKFDTPRRKRQSKRFIKTCDDWPSSTTDAEAEHHRALRMYDLWQRNNDGTVTFFIEM